MLTVSSVFEVVHDNGEWRVESGEWRVESGEWRVESGEWNEDDVACSTPASCVGQASFLSMSFSLSRHPSIGVCT